MAKKKVLLVSDDNLFSEIENSFLYRDECELLFAASGIDAYEAAVEERPDLIFMDVDLPKLSGDECCRRLKANPGLRQIPVILIAHGDKGEELRCCQRAGCDDILLKPLNRQLLVEAGRRHLKVSQRNAPRVPLKLSVHYGVGDEERQLHEYSINVSTGGLFIETGDPPPVSTPLRLEFFLPDQEQPIRCRAQVAWINTEDGQQHLRQPKGMGVQFVDVGLEDMRLIRSFIMQELLI